MRPKNIIRKEWLKYNLLFVAEHFLGYPRFKAMLGKRQKRLFYKIENRLGPSSHIGFNPVQEVDPNMSREEFLETCYRPILPRLFKGAAKDWDAIKHWNLDFFEKHYGEVQITINDNEGLSDEEFEQILFKTYIRQLRSGSRKYLRFSDVVNHNEELKEHIDRKWLDRFQLPFSWGEDMKMFMGAAGTKTNLHVGFSDFLFVQVSGVKKWTLYPPNNRIFLDPRTERTFHYYSRADPKETDNPDFPLLKYAEKFEVTLQPGDVLWVPSFTWHYVENDTETIGVRCGRSSLVSAFRSSNILASLIFLATRPNIFSYALTTRTEKKSLVFAKSYKN